MAVTQLHPEIAAPLGDLTTERLSLRRITRADFEEFAEMFAVREVWEFPHGRGMTRRETRAFLDAQIRLWDECGFGGCTARLQSDGRLVGIVGLSVPTDVPALLPAVSVGWRFAAAEWGNGYATEGARAVLDAAFATMQLDRVLCLTQPANMRSVRLARRLGMRLVRELSVELGEARGALTAVLYEIGADDWRIPSRREGSDDA